MMRGLTYTTGLLLVLLIGLSVVFVVGANLLFGSHKVTQHSLSLKVLLIYNDTTGYDLKMLIHNDGTEPVTIEKIVVFDGERNLTFGDNGDEDGLGGYGDTFKKITIAPGSTYMIEAYHYTPTSFKLNDKVIVLVYYKVPTRVDTLLEAYGGSAYISVDYGGGDGTPPPPPPPPSASLKVSLKYKMTRTMRVDWVEIPINSSIAPNFFNDNKLSVQVKDESGRTLPAKVVYYNKNLGYAVIAVRVSKQFQQGDIYTITITKSETTNQPQSWHWESLWFTRMKQYKTTLYTTITYEYIDNRKIIIRTAPWYRDRPVTVTYVKLRFPVIKAFLFALYEDRLSTSYQIYITMADGKVYKVHFTSCWYYGPELKVWDAKTNKLVLQRELGCNNYGDTVKVFFTSDTNLRPPTSVDATVRLPAPITALEITPVGGDSGNSNAYSYIYVPYLLYPAGAYTFYLFDISYSK